MTATYTFDVFTSLDGFGSPGGGQTTVVWEERGMPVAYLAGYGAGIQVHVEDLGAYLAGRERCDAGARMGELFPAYEPLAAKVS